MKYTDILNQIEDFKILEYGEFEGYHYTSKRAADLIEREGFRGCAWNGKLGFTDRNRAALVDDGAVFAYVAPTSEWYDCDPDAACFHIRGMAYLVEHAAEGEQLIFEADTIKILERR
jgi:hypothetical protein